ncbi:MULTISPECIES: long-chain fatty acid--CoA ligase [unclassified Rhizobacter]|uniref:long-chain fatty acid--CoA ligase n=1 Tax=unclassified Rhizobacter TaxID=2640088 RepID=UPI0006F8099A|nr:MULTISPECIES: long-chain fatty acid--CoA ligase [unclassified Rhizobacter]KQU78383.1 long-chain fatty acid--CoA ligase [Rhizobacter sp. Root29]KQW10903.1 long-chain fatty acid--CoA ligase [Rhizobacter sp. Root1238]KRB25249.1 long-chain fatty acid--CoA ligase [Rhizobacter sp. Root16D2]
MPHAHLAHWPPGLPHHLTLPQTNVFDNLQVSARRYPDKAAVIFYDSVMTYAELLAGSERLAGWLQQAAGVQAGDRVLLYLQNSPQWAMAFYGILRANAVVVPVNPMNRSEELRHYVHDSGARVAIVPQDLLPQMQPLLDDVGDAGLQQLLVVTYADALTTPTDLPVPEVVSAAPLALHGPGLTAWRDAVAPSHDLRPGPLTTGPQDLCVMPYTSGTTGQPKGCMHTHRSVMSTLVGGVQWFGRTQDAVYLSVLPFFHVTGMAGSLNGPLFLGATMVVLARWDRDAAAQCIQRHRATVLQAISTMVVDFLSNPRLADHDLSSLQGIRGGGAAMPAAVAARLRELTGLDYVEGYGMTEAMAATHINPPHRPKPQCLGIPVFDVDARVVDPVTLAELPAGETGEVVVHGPQVMRGYWNDEAATRAAFVEIDGRAFLRTGDLAQVDADGYFFMVDRLKRMINASGFKVWPAEVESLMYRHPGVLEACVIAAHDERRGETVKALVVRRAGHEALTAQALIAWSHEHMAAYKSPRIVEFVTALPKSGSGKVMWRELQERELAAAPSTTPRGDTR